MSTRKERTTIQFSIPGRYDFHAYVDGFMDTEEALKLIASHRLYGEGTVAISHLYSEANGPMRRYAFYQGGHNVTDS